MSVRCPQCRTLVPLALASDWTVWAMLVVMTACLFVGGAMLFADGARLRHLEEQVHQLREGR